MQPAKGPSISSGFLQLRHIEGVMVVTFLGPTVADELAVESIGDQLVQLLVNQRHRLFVLDFGPVKRLSSSLLAKLIVFHKKVKAVGGGIALCGINPQVYPIFEMTHLDRFFGIYPTQAEALQSLTQKRGQSP